MKTQELVEKSVELEVPDFIEFKDQNGFVTKIVNFDSPKMCPRKGIIEVMAIHVSNRHENRKSFSVTRDPVTGIHYGIPAGIDQKTGRVQFKRIIIYNQMHLNLTNPVDAQLWCVISRCEFLLGSPFMVGKPAYKRFDREEEANKVVIENKLKRKASAIIDDVRGVELFDLARACGLSVENDSLTTVQSVLYKKAENNPAEFMNIWDNAHRPVIAVLKRGIATGLVNFDMGKGGYTWKESLYLGANDMQVVKFLMANLQILVQMDTESKQKDNTFKTHATDNDYQKSVIDSLGKDMIETPSYTAKEFSKAEQENSNRVKAKEEKLDSALEEVANMKKQMEEFMSGKKTDKKEKKSETGNELLELQAEATKLGMKGANLIEDMELLKKFISDQNDILGS